MGLSRREKAGMWIGVISTAIPGQIAAGFFPDFNLLPAAGWLLIASLGGAVAGIVASPSVGWGQYPACWRWLNAGDLGLRRSAICDHWW